MPSFDERLHKALAYDPNTGVLIWLQGPYRAHIAGNVDNHGRRRLFFEGVRYLASRLIFRYMTCQWPKNEIDHINRIRDDDRWENLREVTHRQNTLNRDRKNKTGYRGVYPTSNGKYQAMIRENGRTRPLGTFVTPEEAHQAYVEAGKALHGRFFEELRL